MKEGIYVADEYTLTLNDKLARGKFDDMNKDRKIAALDAESKMAMELCSMMAYKFEDGGWHRSTNGGKKFGREPIKNYKVEGEKIILFDTHGAPESTVLFIKNGGIEESVGNVLSVFFKMRSA
jgi:hypothetical protein